MPHTTPSGGLLAVCRLIDQFRPIGRSGPDSGYPRRGRLTAGCRAMPLLPRQPRSAQILTADSVQQQPIAAPEGSEINTESTEIHGKENSNQLPLSVFFCAFRGCAFVMIFLAGVTYPGNQDPHKSLQPIRSSNSRSRLSRDRDQPRNPPKYTEKRIRINFPFPCPSRGQLPPVGWGRSVVTRL